MPTLAREADGSHDCRESTVPLHARHIAFGPAVRSDTMPSTPKSGDWVDGFGLNEVSQTFRDSCLTTHPVPPLE